MRRSLALLALLTALVLTAGCLGLGDQDEEDEVRKQRAEVSEDTGGIEGIVTDEAIQPHEGVEVTVVETGDTTTTADDGSFAFSRLPPATYTVQFEREDLVSAERSVEVNAGEVTRLDIVLSQALGEETFTQRFELVGFIECGVGWTTDPNPLPGATSNAVAVCSVPQIVSPNATNDKFLHTFQLEPPLEDVVYEMTWDAEDTALSTQVQVEGFPFADDATVFAAGDTPPIQTRLERPVWEDLERNFTKRCEGTNDTEQSDDYCGYNFRTDGWPMQTRVFVDSTCNDLPARACHALQQEFTHYVSAFYNQPAPAGYSLLDA